MKEDLEKAPAYEDGKKANADVKSKEGYVSMGPQSWSSSAPGVESFKCLGWQLNMGFQQLISYAAIQRRMVDQTTQEETQVSNHLYLYYHSHLAPRSRIDRLLDPP